MIPITSTLAIDERELHEEFIRSSGPGGQNVNKVATAVQLRFDVQHSPSLPEEVRARLIRIAGSRIVDEGTLVITARSHRTQAQNRQEAINQLVDLIRQATYRPKPHLKTRPTLASKTRRLDSKRRQSERKRGRQSVSRSED